MPCPCRLSAWCSHLVSAFKFCNSQDVLRVDSHMVGRTPIGANWINTYTNIQSQNQNFAFSLAWVLWFRPEKMLWDGACSCTMPFCIYRCIVSSQRCFSADGNIYSILVDLGMIPSSFDHGYSTTLWKFQDCWLNLEVFKSSRKKTNPFYHTAKIWHVYTHLELNSTRTCLLLSFCFNQT